MMRARGLVACWFFTVSKQPRTFVLFTSDFAIETGESDSEGLHGTQRVAVVQRENVVGYSSKLHHNVVHWKTK